MIHIKQYQKYILGHRRCIGTLIKGSQTAARQNVNKVNYCQLSDFRLTENILRKPTAESVALPLDALVLLFCANENILGWLFRSLK